MDEALIPLDEATRRYGIARSTLFAWIEAGTIGRYKRPGDRRTQVNVREIELAARLSRKGPKRPWRS